MIENPKIDRNNFLHDLSSAISKRVDAAETIVTLGVHDNKKLDMVQDVIGHKFIRRTYSDTALKSFSAHGIEFQEAFTSMHDAFSQVDIDIVPSFISNPQREKGEPLVVVSEYLENTYSVMEATLESKKKLAAGLGKLLVSDSAVFPKQEMIQQDMFRVVIDPDGMERVVLLDIDPHVMRRENLNEHQKARYITSTAKIFFKSWCKNTERNAVIAAFGGEITSLFESFPGVTLLDAISHLTELKNGMDLRG